MLTQLFAIAKNTFVEALRQPIYLAVILIGCLLQIFNVALSAYTLGLGEETDITGDNKMLLDLGLATVLGASTLLAAFVATAILSKEIENKTVLTVIAKPVGRPLFIFGKYLGTLCAMILAGIGMLAFFLIAIRHGVLQTARDTFDLPALLFLSLAVFGALGIGAWTNFFYKWVFASTAAGLLTPFLVIAWLLTLIIDPEWNFTNPTETLDAQLLIACATVLMASSILTAFALLASTRLGQVMTTVTCAAIFILGLLSNYLVGRFAYDNTHVARVDRIIVPNLEDFDPTPPIAKGLQRDDVPDVDPILLDTYRDYQRNTTPNGAGFTFTVELTARPSNDFVPGTPIYFGPDPAGIRISVPAQTTFTGDITDPQELQTPSLGKALVVQRYDSETRLLTIVNAGGLAIPKLPNDLDYIFVTPTQTNPAAIATWSIIPNLQSLWLVDALTQGHQISSKYLLTIFTYTVAYIIALLGFATALFQTRDVG